MADVSEVTDRSQERASVLLRGLAFPESARWHDGRLWLAHWGSEQVMAVDLAGTSEVLAAGPAGYGKRLRRTAGTRSPSSSLMDPPATAFDVTADGGLANRRVWADGIAPDGICLDQDGAIWCGAADIAMMTSQSDSPAGAFIRVAEGGAVLDRTGAVFTAQVAVPAAMG